MKFLIPFLILYSSFLIAQEKVSFQGGPEWVFKKKAKNINIYTRLVQGAPLKELKFTMEIEATITNVAAVLLDVNNYKNWVFKCSESKQLDKTSQLSSYDYYIADFPWPLNDRDLFSYSSMWQDPKTKVLTAQTVSKPNYGPLVEEIVRVINHQNQWIITPLGPNKVEIIYFLVRP